MAEMHGDYGRTPSAGDGTDRIRLAATLTGAAVSLALVVSLGVWGYRLAVRDVSGIPVVRALAGPVRIAPEKPGGEVADYQGLAVNEVAAVGTASTPPDRLMLAPKPVDLALDDMAGLSPLEVPTTEAVVAETVQSALAPAPAPEVVQTEDAIAMALAEALADDEGAALPGDGAAPEAVEVADALPGGTVARSLVPRTRPGAGSVSDMGEVTDVSAPPLPPVVEVDPATLQTGTRLVQFGAYDTPDAARADWVKLQTQFGDLMADKAMVIEAASSGGREFFRLRAHGFADEAEARRFCSAMQTENAACIPVSHR